MCWYTMWFIFFKRHMAANAMEWLCQAREWPLMSVNGESFSCTAVICRLLGWCLHDILMFSLDRYLEGFWSTSTSEWEVTGSVTWCCCRCCWVACCVAAEAGWRSCLNDLGTFLQWRCSFKVYQQPSWVVNYLLPVTLEKEKQKFHLEPNIWDQSASTLCEVMR